MCPSPDITDQGYWPQLRFWRRVVQCTVVDVVCSCGSNTSNRSSQTALRSFDVRHKTSHRQLYALCWCTTCIQLFILYQLCQRQSVAALHQGAPGQMTWLEDPPPCLRPAYRFASVIVWTENVGKSAPQRKSWLCPWLRVTWLEDFLTSKWPGSFITALAPPLTTVHTSTAYIMKPVWRKF